jgi:uncharacterized protein (TIGR00252 family)
MTRSLGIRAKTVSTTDTGRMAEAAVASYLKNQGYKILDQNWRTRWCEIDIVAQQGEAIYFVEVKYRKTSNQGDGLDYITPKKLQQMSFAAEFWVARNNWHGEYALAAASVFGDTFEVKNVIEL